MIYRGPGFLPSGRMISLPPPPPPVSKLDRRHEGRLKKRDMLPAGEEGGAKSYDRKKA